MATLEYLHVCDLAFAMEGGKQCIIGIFDTIYASAFPVVHPTMSIAARFRGTPNEMLQIKIELARPNGEALASMQGSMTLAPDGSMFMQMNIAGAQFPEAGRYTFKISAGGQTLTTHPLHVLKAQTQTQSAPPGLPPKQFH
jgi:hypothetical protein